MCGITGVATLDPTRPLPRDRYEAMCRSIVHRGPDGQGVSSFDRVFLGMRRLAIIDVGGGDQPIFNEDGTVAVVFNGEIYNFRELRRELEQKGHHFRTQSDTEVIVHAYEQFGDQFPTRLNGMFGIALYDRVRNRLLLARDHLGIKPLYVARWNGYLVWGSEIKAILASRLIPRELDPRALEELLAWEYVPGSRTLFRHIAKLEPGHVLKVELGSGRVTDETFWDVPNEPEDHATTREEWIERIDAQIRTSVQRQLVSDVPLGAFLSGGVDSSLVVAAMGAARTFSIGFDDPSYNELNFSRRVAAHLGVHHETQIAKPYVADLFDRLAHQLDDPIGDFSIFPTYLVSKLARGHVTVSLCGDGGDELFGGYDTYVAHARSRLLQGVPRAVTRRTATFLNAHLKPRPQKKGFANKVRRFSEGAAYSPGLRHARWRLFADGASLDSLLAEHHSSREDLSGEHIMSLFGRCDRLDPVNQGLYVDTKSYLVDNCLTKVDRMSMAVSLESRVPMLDKDIVELAFRMPGRFKVKGGVTKPLLKQIASKYVPHECVYRQKEGFSIPMKQWLETQFRPLVDDLLEPKRLEQQGIFRSDAMERLKAEHFSGVANHSHLLWTTIVFQRWHDLWLEGAAIARAAETHGSAFGARLQADGLSR